MATFNLQVGDDLDGRTLTLSIPSASAFSSKKVIAATHNGHYIVEGKIGTSNVAGITSNPNWSELTDLDEVFFASPNTNLESVDLPDNFGTIIEIDDTAVCYPYVKRTADEKLYGFTEDFKKVEVNRKIEYGTQLPDGSGYSKGDIFLLIEE